MTNTPQYDEYHRSEEDITKVIAMLRHTDPEHANRETAEEFLDFYEAYFHEAGHLLKDESMQDMYKKFADKGSK